LGWLNLPHLPTLPSPNSHCQTPSVEILGDEAEQLEYMVIPLKCSGIRWLHL